MGWIEGARQALSGHGRADLRLEQAFDVAQAFEAARQALAPGAVADADALPYPKETIRWALLLIMGAIADAAAREPLKAAFLSLAEWQSGAELGGPAFDSLRLRRKLDPLRLARELAARATPEERRNTAVREEQGKLIDELKRKDFW